MVLEDLSRAISSNLGRPDVLGGLLQTFINEGGIGTAICRALRRVASSEQAVLRQFSANGLVLINCPDFRLFVEKVAKPTPSSLQFQTPRAYLHTEAAHSVAILRTLAPLTVERFVPDRPLENEVFEAGVGLVPSERYPYDGRPIMTRFDEHAVFRWSSNEAAFMLKLAYVPYSTQTWLFDAETLTSIFAAAIDPAASGMVAIAKMLGAMQRPDALPFLANLRAHPQHFVRWAAVQAVGRIDGTLARRFLEEAKCDPHPYIQSAAQRVLSRIA